ncbi:hypothetical protein DFJ73DRAFT_833568 [Zopfochytrium polystomum]|nr:hypothetical protein DFJ73DRAFT_833568 [Zopfochytrium polystomum]
MSSGSGSLRRSSPSRFSSVSSATPSAFSSYSIAPLPTTSAATATPTSANKFGSYHYHPDTLAGVFSMDDAPPTQLSFESPAASGYGRNTSTPATFAFSSDPTPSPNFASSNALSAGGFGWNAFGTPNTSGHPTVPAGSSGSNHSRPQSPYRDLDHGSPRFPGTDRGRFGGSSPPVVHLGAPHSPQMYSSLFNTHLGGQSTLLQQHQQEQQKSQNYIPTFLASAVKETAGGASTPMSSSPSWTAGTLGGSSISRRHRSRSNSPPPASHLFLSSPNGLGPNQGLGGGMVMGLLGPISMSMSSGTDEYGVDQHHGSPSSPRHSGLFHSRRHSSQGSGLTSALLEDAPPTGSLYDPLPTRSGGSSSSATGTGSISGLQSHSSSTIALPLTPTPSAQLSHTFRLRGQSLFSSLSESDEPGSPRITKTAEAELSNNRRFSGGSVVAAAEESLSKGKGRAFSNGEYDHRPAEPRPNGSSLFSSVDYNDTNAQRSNEGFTIRVVGFPPEKGTALFDHFSRLGPTLRSTPPRPGVNFMHITYVNRREAKKALEYDQQVLEGDQYVIAVTEVPASKKVGGDRVFGDVSWQSKERALSTSNSLHFGEEGQRRLPSGPMKSGLAPSDFSEKKASPLKRASSESGWLATSNINYDVNGGAGQPPFKRQQLAGLRSESGDQEHHGRGKLAKGGGVGVKTLSFSSDDVEAVSVVKPASIWSQVLNGVFGW